MPPLREHYLHRLAELEREWIALGRMADEAIRRALWALKQGALEEARAIVRRDKAIDEATDALVQHAIEIIATQGPVAGDLRLVSSFMQGAVELERIADYAKGIATVVLRLGGPSPGGVPEAIEHMAALTRKMLNEALEALIARDPSINLRLKQEDEAVDAAYAQLFDAQIERMERDPAMVRPGTFLLWIGHNLERIGDRATNIGEYVEYIVRGVKIGRRQTPAE
ncbi:MAG: phosphate signaling complex protein PhoU [Oscillochloridaceae bacterium]|nr:phosphate signaling complex protein PhoU [Chloroflexaceae bacterium]MDW8389394.1 phosphate signaling complex protein PhoU [Oscillochloridaceae bacterium]